MSCFGGPNTITSTFLDWIHTVINILLRPIKTSFLPTFRVSSLISLDSEYQNRNELSPYEQCNRLGHHDSRPVWKTTRNYGH